MAGKKVGIFGGGMAGLSAAHELVHRGYEVHVFESSNDPGGKSKNQAVANAVDGRAPGVAGPPPTAAAPDGTTRPVPGEHGFRFFPGFYRHIIATMKEIPHAIHPNKVVADDLVPSEEAGVARGGGGVLPFPRRLDHPPGDVSGKIVKLYGGLGFQPEDLARMAWFRLKYLTSGMRRREGEYESKSWWEFIDGDSPRYSDDFRRFEEAIPRTMSAMEPKLSSARVIGDITMQMALGYGRPFEEPDRLLVGPSSERWIDPWMNYLTAKGVHFHPNRRLTAVQLTPDAKAIGKAVLGLDTAGTSQDAVFDHYVLAVPVEEARRLLEASPLGESDPALEKLKDSPIEWTNWMSGAQFFLKDDHPMVSGHVFYPESEWALTSISQAQFWNQGGGNVEERYGRGTIRGILSVILSEWDVPGSTGKTARQSGSPEEVLDETLRQLRQATGEPWLDWEKNGGDVLAAHLDESIEFGPSPATGLPEARANRFPLLVHRVGSWSDRPDAKLEKIHNLYLAADYVRTNTQLATMEGANEAARRAVNAILDEDGSLHTRCEIWPLQEEPVFDAARRLDDRRFDEGRKHVMDEYPVTLALEGPAVTLDLLASLLEAGGACLSAL